MVGLGFRRDIHNEILDLDNDAKPDFVELAPENWMRFGGYWGSIFKKIKEKYPIICHGLSLSIGSPDDIDDEFLNELNLFFAKAEPLIYSEHLSYSKCDNAHIYDLLPIPFRQDAVNHIVERIKYVQDKLERKISLENVSYYSPIGAEMTEQDFLSQILEKSDCNLLLDVNNVYVNAFNHKYDAKEFLDNIPLDRVSYIHIAGHDKVEEDLIIDTHGQDIIDPVFDLFEWTIAKIKPVPVLLERDFNMPEIEVLIGEINRIRKIAKSVWGDNYVVK
jgi:hypothetical protein